MFFRDNLNRTQVMELWTYILTRQERRFEHRNIGNISALQHAFFQMVQSLPFFLAVGSGIGEGSKLALLSIFKQFFVNKV
jgi:hypothetical protein